MPVTADMIALAAKIEAMPLPDRLRLASALMELKEPKFDGVAYGILERVTTELGAAIALREIEEKRRR